MHYFNNNIKYIKLCDFWFAVYVLFSPDYKLLTSYNENEIHPITCYCHFVMLDSTLE